MLPLTGQAKSQRAALISAHLEMVKELAGLRKTTPTDVVYAELNEMPLDPVWLLQEQQGCGMLFMRDLSFMPVCSKVLSQGLVAGTG